MRVITFEEVRAMKGNGSSMRIILKYFMDKGAKVSVLFETNDPVERYFLVEMNQLRIPLRAAKLNFYSTYNSLLAQTISTDKLKSNNLLLAFGVPTPKTEHFTDVTAAEKFLRAHDTIVIKPRDGSHGEGITTNVQSKEDVEYAVAQARAIDQTVLMQQQITGSDYRLLFIDGKHAAAVKRIPASVTGDGTRNIKELIDAYNDRIATIWVDMREGRLKDDEVRGSVSKIPIPEVVAAYGESILEKIPDRDEVVEVVKKANVSLGGQTEDVTDLVNNELIHMIEDLLAHIGMPLCGVDVISTDISSSPHEAKSFVIELNAAPGLRLHELPTRGTPRMVCAQVAESLITHYKGIAKIV